MKFSNVNYEEFKTHLINGVKKRRLYKMTCIKCGKDRGYKVLNEAKRACLNCHTLKMTKKTKEQKRIYCSMKANISQRFRWRKIEKDAGIFRHLPYKLEDLIVHLESQFEDWMNWNNYGLYNQDIKTWQIDHIIPDSHFVYKSFSDQGFKDSWNLSNLRPLESIANILKSDTYKE